MGTLTNAIISFLVPLPSILFHLSFVLHHHRHSATSSPIHQWCLRHPLLLSNLLFLLNVDLLFWLLGLLLFRNHWMIDLYWTVIPVLLTHYFSTHPMAEADARRSAVAITLVWAWSARLTHSYFRRERWELGAREDWRFAEMKTQHGKHWWWLSFFAVYVSQQVFLIGICLPMYAIHSSNRPWDSWDSIATVVCITGIVIAYFADTQLHNFVQRNETLREQGISVLPNLDEGLWGYSRHPNYFGEQLWWWGLFIFGWNVGQGWMLVGPLTNSLCLAYVTVLVEQRMLKREYRAEAYRQYQKTTSVWIPWFRSAIRGPKEKNI